MAGIREAGFGRDFLDRHSLGEKVFGIFEPDTNLVGVGRHSHGPFEFANEMEFADAGSSGQFIKRELSCKMTVDIFARQPYLSINKSTPRGPAL